MKKILLGVLALVLFGVFSCKQTPPPAPPAPTPTPTPENPLEGAWTITSVVLDDALKSSLQIIAGYLGMPIDLEGNMLDAMSALGMTCISEGQLTFAEKETFSFAICLNGVDGTYTYDEKKGTCTLTVDDVQISEEPISVDGTFTETQLKFTIGELLGTVPDLSDRVIDQIEATTGEPVDYLTKTAIQVFIASLQQSTGEITFVKEVAE